MTTLSAFTVNDPRLTFDPDAHRYQLGRTYLPSVTQILQQAGVADFSAPWFSEAVKERGTFVHQAIALDNAGDLDDATLDPVLVPYVAGWRAFRAETGAVVEHWEQPLCDPILGFAGTLDGIVVMSSGGWKTRTLIDIKSALYPSAGPQTAAYRRCAYSLYPNTNETIVLHRAVLVLPGDGTYRWHPLTDHVGDERVFLAALTIVNFRRRHDAGH